MNMLENNDNSLSDNSPKYINGFICLKTLNEFRIAFIEEKISDNLEEIKIDRKCTNQIVMSKENAEKLAQSILDTLNE